MRRNEAIRKLESLAPDYAQFDVKTLAVFGSVARDEATIVSDMDILVEFNGPSKWDNYIGLKLFLEEAMGVPVDLVMKKVLKERLRPYIERDAIRVA